MQQKMDKAIRKMEIIVGIHPKIFIIILRVLNAINTSYNMGTLSPHDIKHLIRRCKKKACVDLLLSRIIIDLVWIRIFLLIA